MKNKTSLFLLFIVLCLLFLTPYSFAQELLKFTPVTPITLDNGLTVILKENHTAPVATMRIYVRTGSIYEQEYVGAGISHLFEHLIAGGSTTTRSEDETRQILDSIGGNANAYTTKDHTAFFITTSTDHFDTVIELMADWMQNSTFPENEFNREWGVVQRELEQDENDPESVLYDLASANMFRVHPEKYPIIGYKEILQKLTRDDVIKYYKRMYSPDNMIVVAVGDFNKDEVLEKIKKAFQNFERRSLPPITLPEEPPQVSKRLMVKEMDVQVALVRMDFRTVNLLHPDLYPLDVLDFILSHGESSRLVRKIKGEQQLVYSLSTASYTPHYRPGNFMISISLDPAHLEEAQKAILSELYRLKTELVTETELQKAKKQKISDYIFGLQTVEGQATDLGINMLGALDPNFSQKYVENIQKVTAEDIRRVVNKYFFDDNLCITRIVPKSKPSESATSKKPEEKPTPSPIKKIVLDNGMTLLIKRNPGVPLISLQAYFKGGLLVENEKNNGISNFMAEMLLKGTKTRTALDIASFFDSIGGSIEASSGNNTFSISALILSSDFDPALEVFADVIQNSSFPVEEMEKLRKILLADIKRIDENWESESEAFFRQNFFVKSPYRYLALGSEETVGRLTRQDLQEFYRTFCVPNNMVLAIFGDIDPHHAEEAVKREFSNFEKNPSLKFPEVPPEPPLDKNREAHKTTEKTVAVVYLGYRGMDIRNVKDRDPMTVVDAIISGIGYPSGWLHTELRGKQLVYVVHAYNFAGFIPGFFAIYAATQPDKVQEVVQIILETIRKIKEDPIDPEELERAKSEAIIAYGLEQETNVDQAREAAINELAGLGYNFKDNYAQRIRAVTPEEVKRVVHTYFTNYVLTITSPKTP